MSKAVYFDGLFLDMDCGHRIWGHINPELFDKFHENSFDVEIECPECKKIRND